jgi:colicin import membrane protein
MSEQKESSVLFSLKELMSLEEDRIRSEEAERTAAAAAAEKARVDAERAARDAEEHRIRAEEERRRLEDQRSREEAARLEAIRVAEIEKARIDAEGRARMEAMAAQQAHERNLAAIKQDESKKSLRKTLIGIIAAVVVVGGLATFLVVKNYQDNQARIAAQAEEQRQLADEKAKLQEQAKAAQAKIDGLLSQLSSAKDDATRLALQKQLQDEQQKQQDALSAKKTGGGGPRSGAAASPGGSKPPCNCTPGDPLCSCL